MGTKKIDLSGYRHIAGYGIGQYYDYVKSRIPPGIHIDYLCDTRWEQIGKVYDGIKVVSPDELGGLEDIFVIVFSGNQRNFQSISGMLERLGLPYAHADKVMDAGYSISGRRLKELGDGVYTDTSGNRIEYSNDIEDALTVAFYGGGNLIRIGRHVSIGRLGIFCGNNAVCRIGEGTEIEEADIFVTGGSVLVGEDCLLSYRVALRNHDTHHIFDRDTGKRVNYGGNMEVGDHVWLGYGVTLLGDAHIGDNSIVGTMAVTSGTFPKEVIIAGNPAKIIRENVCWSKDNTNFFNRDYFEGCLAKEALKYF